MFQTDFEKKLVLFVSGTCAVVAALRDTEKTPTAACILCAVCVAIHVYVYFISDTFQVWDWCISGPAIYERFEFGRIFTSPFLHGDIKHIYFNMCSLLIKAVQLEVEIGFHSFIMMSIVLAFTGSFIYVILAYITGSVSCAVGYSGVLFAYKVILGYRHPKVAERAWMGSVPLPCKIKSKYIAWVELVLANFMIPNASFIGHLAGMLAGYLMVAGYLNPLMRTKEKLNLKRLQGLKLFKKFDKDDNGVMSQDELNNFYQFLNEGGYLNKVNSVEELMKQVDTDGDGLFEKHEFLAWMKKNKVNKAKRS